MWFESFVLSIIQYELREVAAQAQQRYYDKFPNPSNWTVGALDDYIFKAIEKVKTTSKTELKKQLPCVDPKLTLTFLEHVKLHYEKFDEDPKIAQEKLWIFATSAIDPSKKSSGLKDGINHLLCVSFEIPQTWIW